MSIFKYYKNRKDEVITIELDDDMSKEELSDLIEYAVDIVTDDLDTFVDTEIGEFEAQMMISEYGLSVRGHAGVVDKTGTADINIYKK